MKAQQRVLQQMAEVEQLLAAEDVKVESVSKWSVYQQVEHILLANTGIVGMIEKNQQPEERRAKTFLGRFVLFTGKIPRGRGKAPTPTVPEGRTRDELLTMRENIEKAVSQFDIGKIEQDDKPIGNHPYFGGLSAAEWLRFMGIHDNHHLKIVADIRAQVGNADQ